MRFRTGAAWGLVLETLILTLPAQAGTGVEVSGRVEMPPTCAPEISPAVVWLEPTDPPSPAQAATTATAPAVTVNQRGLRFDPRIVALPIGQSVQFGNGDPETHNIHIMAPGVNFNQSVPPSGQISFTPDRAGIFQVLCDVHSHMKAFVVVGPSPWVMACTRTGRFRFDDVPDGRYRLHVWHEMGDQPVIREVAVQGTALDLGSLTVTSRAPASLATGAMPVEPWSDVLDHISMTLAQSLDAAGRPAGRDRAVQYAQDAYFAQYEASDLETAVRSYLGTGRNYAIESRFRQLARSLSDPSSAASRASEQVRALMLDLVQVVQELNAQGITDRSKVLASVPGGSSSTSSAPAPSSLAAPSTSLEASLEAQVAALETALGRVRTLADSGQRMKAALTLAEDGYFGAFEPIERVLQIREPGEVRALEARFNVLRGKIGDGLAGEALGSELDALRADVGAAVARATEPQSAGRFGLSFVASLGTILREGIEVILLLTMLFALVAKAGRPDLVSALRWGVALAVAASAATALGLNWLVGSTAGRVQELLEGAVLLTASGVLFYVSYWLISQSQSQKWLEFLKRQTTQGARRGAAWALGLTAFLAIYREGAEVALMYQSMISLNQGAQAGMMGILAGLGVGLPILGVLFVLIRMTSIRLPMKLFFQVTGALLFALAVVFAGHGVFELQSSEIVRTTALPWLGRGIPVLGLYPNVQCLAVQGVLLGGAMLALVFHLIGIDRPRPMAATLPTPRTAAGTGV